MGVLNQKWKLCNLHTLKYLQIHINFYLLLNTKDEIEEYG